MAGGGSCSWLLLALLLLLAAKPAPCCCAFPLKFKASAISAPPAILPSFPEFGATAPALPPDVMPAFPTPGGGGAPQSSFPTIPSSPSPPNPDELQLGSEVAPAAALTSVAVRLTGGAALCGLVLMWWLDFVGN
ncbi:classical arabinogalactan protein 26 [Zingiber officinale]|uniref:classical arabinogalactan protein 26 n=1 Tax=Zingiber officinale TaxID=94328 RepID=UPI001C4CDE11|nr:classical arabinogalactan protein 26 [Zingiber officinale]